MTYQIYAASRKYLTDQTFLHLFERYSLKEQYVKIILLDQNDEILIKSDGTASSIEGVVTQGSINVNGKSAIRRSGSMTLIANEENCKIQDPENAISIKMRFAIEVGFINEVGGGYEEMLWFPQGVFVATAASIIKNLTQYTISLSFKDKMALLNGELGGVFPSSVDLHQKEVSNPEDKTYTLEKLRIRDAVVAMINEYSEITLVDGYTEEFDSVTYRPKGGNPYIEIPIKAPAAAAWLSSDDAVYATNAKGSVVYFMTLSEWQAWKEQNPEVADTFIETQIKYGDDIGWFVTDFTYPGELVGAAGSNIAAILDKIQKGVMTNYEYFFDTYGNFHFSEIKNSLTNKDKIESVYDFSDLILVQAIQNAPNYLSLKNDFIVWGERKLSSGKKAAIQYRFAFDKTDFEPKPYYVRLGTEKYTGSQFWIKSEEGQQDMIVVPQHYMEYYYLEGLFGNITAYYPELSAQLLYIVDLSKDDETRKAAWQNPRLKVESNYWLDLTSTKNLLQVLDQRSMVASLDVDTVGRRMKVFNEKNVNRISKMETLPLRFYPIGTEPPSLEEENITLVAVTEETYGKISQGSIVNPADAYIRSSLHGYISFNETVTLTLLPMYWLEPNTCITMNNVDTSVEGQYIIESFTVPLDVGATMSLKCTKALQMLTTE